MNQRIKITLSLFATMVLAFVGIFFSIKGTNGVSVVKNEKMPFMGNTYVSYGGFSNFAVSDITNTEEAVEIKESYDDACDSEDCGSGLDFVTMLKVKVDITAATDELSEILLVNVDDKTDIGTDFAYYYEYYDDAHERTLRGTDEDNDDLIEFKGKLEMI